MRKIQKQCIPIFLDDDEEPVAFIYFTKHRERVIFVVKKADEDEIISLFEQENTKIKSVGK